MTSELQAVVDNLAELLDTPTVLEDYEERMVVYSSQSQPIDEVRRDSILRRRTRPEVMTWFRDQGILQATKPLRIPGDPVQRILGRLCAPVRHHGRLMGWLFMIDDDQRLTDADVAAASRAAWHAAQLLYEEELAERLTSGALSHLLSPAAELREAAAAQITDQGQFPARAASVAAVIQPLGLEEAAARECVNAALRDAAQAWGLRLPGGPGPRPAGQALWLGCADHGVVLTRARTARDDGPGIVVAREVCAALRHRIRDIAGARVVAAVGDPQAKLTDAYLSYRQARLAAKVAAVMPIAGDVTRWRDLGVFRALTQLPEPSADSALDPRLNALFAAGEPGLANTLETYLDLGCDVKTVAARLHLHRATLYYRLEKVQRITGVNLRDGNDRLAIHLGFKLARLAGLHPYTDEAVPPADDHMPESAP